MKFSYGALNEKNYNALLCTVKLLKDVERVWRTYITKEDKIKRDKNISRGKFMGQLHIGNLVIAYEERHSPRAKRLTISVVKDEVRVSIPKGLPAGEVKRFVESKKEWIFKHVQAYQSKIKDILPRDYVSGEKFPYIGRQLLLNTKTHHLKYTTIQFEANSILVAIPEDFPESSWPEMVREALIFAYKAQAKKILKEKVEHFSKLMSVNYNDMRIKEQKTRWGSCSGKGNINFNWRVIMAPNQVIDYLVIHELSHLRHLNHSEDFWHVVASYMPDYKKWERWLKKHGKELVL